MPASTSMPQCNPPGDVAVDGVLAMSLLRAGLDGSQMRLQHRCVGHHLATVMAVVMAVITSVQICSDIRWFSGSFPLLSISKPISKPIPKPILLLIITNYYRFSRKISHDHQLNLGERRSAASYVAPSPPNRLRPWKQRWPFLPNVAADPVGPPGPPGDPASERPPTRNMQRSGWYAPGWRQKCAMDDMC